MELSQRLQRFWSSGRPRIPGKPPCAARPAPPHPAKHIMGRMLVPCAACLHPVNPRALQSQRVSTCLSFKLSSLLTILTPSHTLSGFCRSGLCRANTRETTERTKVEAILGRDPSSHIFSTRRGCNNCWCLETGKGAEKPAVTKTKKPLHSHSQPGVGLRLLMAASCSCEVCRCMLQYVSSVRSWAKFNCSNDVLGRDAICKSEVRTCPRGGLPGG